MTPKEKALELWEKYFRLNYDWDGVTKDEWAKEGALIAVDELISEVYNISHQYTATYDENTKFWNYTNSKELNFWQEVKQEIEKL